MKRIVMLFAALIFCASLCWGQYSTTYQVGVTDITSYLPTTNAWKALPVVNCPGGLSIGSDGTLLCLDISGHVWGFTVSSQTWSQNTFAGMGNGLKQVAAKDAVDVYALGAGGLQWATCQTQGHGAQGLRRWSGSSYVALNGCLTQLAVGSDGVLVGTNLAYPGLAYQSIDGGTIWTIMSGGGNGPNLTYVSAASASSMCGVSSGVVYTMLGSGTGFTQLSAQPGGIPVGCTIFDGSDPWVLTWNASGVVKLYDIGNGAWSAVAGTMYGLTSETKAKTFGLDASGHPYHLNVYPGYISGTTTGSMVNGCGIQTCPPNAIHTGTLQVKFPHGMFGAQGQQAVSPSTNMNVSSFDTSVLCDPFTGVPGDPECESAATGAVTCSVSGTQIATAPPPPHYQYSENYVQWDTTRSLISSFAWKGNGWSSTEKCGTTVTGCTTGTIPYCGDDALNFTLETRPSTKAIQDQAVSLECLKGPFATAAVYYPGQPNSCVLVAVDKHAKIPQPCF